MGKRTAAHDQTGMPGMGRYEHPVPEQTDMGADPDPLAVGAELVMSLPGERTAYFISALPDGSGVLYRHVTETGALSGVTSTADRAAMAREMRARARASEPQQHAVLAGINAANAKLWGRA
jgi:hypothetical protein